MKKIIVCLMVAFIATVCMFSAGCIDTNKNSGTYSDNSANVFSVKSEQEEEFNKLNSIIKNPPANYEVKRDMFNMFKYDQGTTKLWVYFVESVPGSPRFEFARGDIRVAGIEFVNIPNGVAVLEFENSYGTNYNYLIKDSSISESYFVSIVENRPDGSRGAFPYVAFLTPSAYDELLQEIKERFPKAK